VTAEIIPQWLAVETVLCSRAAAAASGSSAAPAAAALPATNVRRDISGVRFFGIGPPVDVSPILVLTILISHAFARIG
jgi:hypothetical protein